MISCFQKQCTPDVKYSHLFLTNYHHVKISNRHKFWHFFLNLTSAIFVAAYMAIVVLLYHSIDQPATKPATRPWKSLSRSLSHRSVQWTSWKSIVNTQVYNAVSDITVWHEQARHGNSYYSVRQSLRLHNARYVLEVCAGQPIMPPACGLWDDPSAEVKCQCWSGVDLENLVQSFGQVAHNILWGRRRAGLYNAGFTSHFQKYPEHCEQLHAGCRTKVWAAEWGWGWGGGSYPEGAVQMWVKYPYLQGGCRLKMLARRDL